VEESEASTGRPDRGKQVEHIEVPLPVHVTRSDSRGDRLRRANLSVEEPDALITHVRVCGGAGWVTTGSTRHRIAARLRLGMRPKGPG